MVAMTPLIVIQAMGLVYGAKLKTVAVESEAALAQTREGSVALVGSITDYNVEAYYD
jgi:hypothetical protein